MTGEELRKLRVEHDLSQRELGEKIGYETTRISLWERGRVPISRTGEKRIRLCFKNLDRNVRDVITHPPRGKEITMLREKYGYSQEYLSEVIGVSQATLHLYEHEIINPSPDVSDTLCEVFGIRLQEDHRKSVRTSSGVRFGW